MAMNNLLITTITTITAFSVMTPCRVTRKGGRGLVRGAAVPSHNSDGGHVSICGDSGDNGDERMETSGEVQYVDDACPARISREFERWAVELLEDFEGVER
jgi:hypothetical protein